MSRFRINASTCEGDSKMEKKQMAILAVLLITIVISAVLFYGEWVGGFSWVGISDGSNPQEQYQFSKNLDVWFMLMLVAFLMIFIRKFEWGVCLATILSAASSFVIYLALQQFVFDYGVWDQALLIKAVICSITLVIAIGVFLGTCKMWQYLLVGIAFAVVYCLVEYVLANVSVFGDFATDPGGSVLVHLCAAYFGIGVALGIRDKTAFNEPMYTTTHSVTFVWLASMLLWMLWPSFVCSLLPLESVTLGTITCYMAGIGSLLSTYFVSIMFGKVNPLIYTYAMLCGPVAIGAPLLSVGPWGALLIGLIAGAVSTLCFIYLQPWFTKKLGVMDMMGVHNLHGVGGWMGAIFVSLIVGSMTTFVMAIVVFVIVMVTGFVIGLVVRFTRGQMDAICDDDTDFVKSEAPAEGAEPVAASEA